VSHGVIESYTDHAANERTYLAWVRTALAFMGFGLLVERFDLFVRSVAGVSVDAAGGSSGLTGAIGLVLIGLGIVVLGISSFRYLRFKRYIAAEEAHAFRSSRTDLVLVAIVAVIDLCMAGYVVAQALGRL